MLTSDLLVARVHNGRIEPVYAPLNEEYLEVAESVIGAFERHTGGTYGELMEELEGLEEINYRLIRGLAQILERRCLISADSVIDPVDARREIFAASRGLVTDEREREDTLRSAAEKLSITPGELERALFADHEENLVVKDFLSITPEDLIRQYNLSLAQTLLFRAAGMEIQMEGNYQPLFWRVKQLRLMYSILDDKIYLDGPISLFRMTERYGTAFAELLPTIMKSKRWSLKADVLRKTPQGKRVYDFTLDHTSKQLFSPEIEVKETFDSAIEKEFYNLSFKGWTVRREPTVLKTGRYAFIPDFLMEQNGTDTRIYVEIIGFWTPEYLKNKIQKINQLKEKESMILLVNKMLSCSGSEFDTDNVIFYDKRIPQLEIIKILRKYEEKRLNEEKARLSGMEIPLDGSSGIISLDEMAKEYGVSLKALRDVVKGRIKNIADYLLLGDQLVGSQILKTIQTELNGVKRHEDALKIFEKYGIKAHSQALECLGYKVKWIGLNPENTEIIKVRI
jgi:predicted nuclease of restriction endonuclease-like RecB superfamily